MSERERFFALVARYNQIGRLLPSEDEVIEDREARESAKLLLAEMTKVKAEMDELAESVSRGKA